MPQRFAADYMSIPGRWNLMRRMLTRSGRRALPQVPSPIGIIQRCLVMHQASEMLPAGPLDLVLEVPALAGANLMDFSRHAEVFEAAYHWCRREIDELIERANPALAALLATKD
jgi:NTE family protein